jgi:hypothetical protein
MAKVTTFYASPLNAGQHYRTDSANKAPIKRVSALNFLPWYICQLPAAGRSTA